MSTETITIYRLGQPPLENVDPKRIIWTDRTRIEDGLCPRKRYLRYNLGGTGYVVPGSNEDLVIGGATHEGLDLLLQGGSVEKAFIVADDYFWENIVYPDSLLPEQQDRLGQDGSHLARAFIWAFYSTYLQDLTDNYEIIGVEEEINWLIAELDEPIGGPDLIVMMSRPDGLVRHKATGELWHLSHKTSQEFNDLQVQKLQIDIQRFSESLAIWAKYGEPVKGTLYNYFLKGKRYEDKNLGVKRFSSGLIHPWMQRINPGGDISAEMLSFVYEWNELDGHLLKGRRLGKGWERVTIYEEMDFEIYLDWIGNGAVPRYKDYLKESVVGLKEEFFDQEYALRWLAGIAYSEKDWAIRADYVKGMENDPPHVYHFDREIPLQSSQCFDWGKKCSYHNICWDHASLPSLIEDGSLVERSPNHLIERSTLE